MSTLKIVLASDHAGFELKNELEEYIHGELGYAVEDMGAYTLDQDDDYVDFIERAGEAVAEDPEHVRGIILGGSGQGEAMCANRFPHVRATTYYHHNLDIIRLSREHNDANVLSIGARFIRSEEAREAVALWLSTPFSSDERHARRIHKLG
jgi:ribose 5-phosphate isomerase B